MYELFFTLDDLWRAAARWGSELHLVAMQRRLPIAGIPRQESALYLTARVPLPLPPGAPDLLAGRIVLERFETFPPDQAAALYAGSTARAAQAVALVRAAATAAGVAVADYGSVLGAPGLLKELLTLHTQQTLWRYARPAPDPITWVLMPLPPAAEGSTP